MIIKKKKKQQHLCTLGVSSSQRHQTGNARKMRGGDRFEFCGTRGPFQGRDFRHFQRLFAAIKAVAADQRDRPFVRNERRWTTYKSVPAGEQVSTLQRSINLCAPRGRIVSISKGCPGASRRSRSVKKRHPHHNTTCCTEHWRAERRKETIATKGTVRRLARIRGSSKDRAPESVRMAAGQSMPPPL